MLSEINRYFHLYYPNSLSFPNRHLTGCRFELWPITEECANRFWWQCSCSISGIPCRRFDSLFRKNRSRNKYFLCRLILTLFTPDGQTYERTDKKLITYDHTTYDHTRVQLILYMSEISILLILVNRQPATGNQQLMHFLNRRRIGNRQPAKNFASVLYGRPWFRPRWIQWCHSFCSTTSRTPRAKRLKIPPDNRVSGHHRRPAPPLAAPRSCARTAGQAAIRVILGLIWRYYVFSS